MWKELTDIFKQNSGFIFTQVHNVMGDTPSENIIAMLDEAYSNSANEINCRLIF